MKKVTFYLSDENNDLLDKVAFLTKSKKVNLVNSAVDEYLKKIITKENLEEKLKALKK